MIVLVSITVTLSIAYYYYNSPRCTQWVEIDTGNAVYRERLCSTAFPTRFVPPQK